jgi:cellulose synthase/poly-beta-1,6-N-acetylglucosamine synthase-like glycosyltransferase
MKVVEIVFWSSLGLIAYVYAGYPLLLLLWSRLAPRRVRRSAVLDAVLGADNTSSEGVGSTTPAEPSLSLVLAVRNGADHLQSKLANLIALDYPRDRVEIVVSLDGPSPESERIAARFADRGVLVVRSDRHQGKAAALNRGVAASRGELVVFCDARQRVAADALRSLVASFADPEVGAASGELMLLDENGGVAGDGVGLYWRYEKALRAMESRIHSTVGATGALYAVRRELFSPLPEGTLLDDVLVPMRIVLRGKRTVFEPGARAYDLEAPLELEFKRKVRTLAGNFQLLQLLPGVLDPRRNPVFLQFVSHKIGRLLVPHLLIAVLVSNLFLLHGIYLPLLAAQCVFYALAIAGTLAPRFQRIPYEFVRLNWAAMRALFCFLRRGGLAGLWVDDVDFARRRQAGARTGGG